ncbi:MAG: hypothetical protein LBR78_01675 [Holosporales bacterium]|jgi:NADH-quinone oxidoreductase subunit N|nr:hypothetical protein [Holosporales bacterium]
MVILFARELLTELAFVLPDIMVGGSFVLLALMRLLIGNQRSSRLFPKLSVLIASVGFVATLRYGPLAKECQTTLFTYTCNLSCMKSILLGACIVGLIIMNRFKAHRLLDSSVYPLAFGLITSIMVCISANSFLSLVIGLEIYSFSLCFLLLMDKETTELRKSAIRFILVSSIMTAVLLFGVSLYYTQFVCLSFHKIKLDTSLASAVGSIFVVSGLLFKVGVAPFHSWMIDVYERASTPLIMFMDTVWKFFMVFIFAKVFKMLVAGEGGQYGLMLTVFSITSMLIGGIMPIFQENIKRFIAYASVGHIGFVLSVFATASTMQPIAAALSYLATYSIAAICFFLALMILEKGRRVKCFKDLSGLMARNTTLGFAVLLSMLAMVALPPFANFMAKVNIFKLLIASGNYWLITASIIYSVLSVFYVARSMRYMFMSPTEATSGFAEAGKGRGVILLYIPMILLIFLYDNIVSLLSRVFAQ